MTRPPVAFDQGHRADSLALSCSITLIYSFVELYVIRIAPLVSLKARAILIVLVFFGLGIVLARGRDFSLRFTGVWAVEKSIVAHDLIYSVIVNALLARVVYEIAGASFSQLLRGTSLALLLSSMTGPINGLMIDRFRSWLQMPHSGRFTRVASAPSSWLNVLLSAAIIFTTRNGQIRRACPNRAGQRSATADEVS
jgi:hypothetical protein